MNKEENNVYQYSLKSIDGQEINLSQFKGKVLLIVNTASKCGFTPQYKELQELYLKYRDQGLEILALPCNQFGSQEPGSEEEIKNFCELNYQVTFPLFAKIAVNGKETHPLYDYLKSSVPGLLGTEVIKWNFTKFLVDRSGRPLARFSPNEAPLKLEKDIKALLL